MQAAQIAMRNHSKEKADALRSALFHSGLRTPIADDLQAVFLHYIDVLTPWQMQLLSLFANPSRWRQANGEPWPAGSVLSVGVVVETEYPELRERRNVYEQWTRELRDRGLLDDANLGGGLAGASSRGHEMHVPHITELGRSFLRFISTPETSRAESD